MSGKLESVDITRNFARQAAKTLHAAGNTTRVALSLFLLGPRSPLPPPARPPARPPSPLAAAPSYTPSIRSRPLRWEGHLGSSEPNPLSRERGKVERSRQRRRDGHGRDDQRGSLELRFQSSTALLGFAINSALARESTVSPPCSAREGGASLGGPFPARVRKSAVRPLRQHEPAAGSSWPECCRRRRRRRWWPRQRQRQEAKEA